jgi:hypothetical protein
MPKQVMLVESAHLARQKTTRGSRLLWLDAPSGLYNLKCGGKPRSIWRRVEDTRSTPAFGKSCKTVA